jgi:mannose-6-phosphate isomerase-like protein (cupin superfamily)
MRVGAGILGDIMEKRTMDRGMDWGVRPARHPRPVPRSLVLPGYGPSQGGLRRAPHNAGPALAGARNTGPVDYRPVDIAEKLSLFSEQWAPKVVARMNDYEVKVVKLEGEFVWHTHEDTDELFLVTSGELIVQMRDGNVTLGPGQLFVVPSGVEHCPITEGEAHVVLIEPAGVVNTGDAGGDFTTTPQDL